MASQSEARSMGDLASGEVGTALLANHLLRQEHVFTTIRC